MVKKRNPQNPRSSRGDVGFFLMLSEVMNRVGVVGFLVLWGAAFMWWFSTEMQRKEFIDTWFLLRTDDNRPSFLIITVLFILLIIQQFHYLRMRKMDKERLEECASEKRSLQANLLNRKNLRSSK